MTDDVYIERISALFEREAETIGGSPSVSKRPTHRKVSRRKLLDDYARADRRYHEAKARHDALHHSGRGLTFEQAQRSVESAQALLRVAEDTLGRERTFAASLPSNMKHEALEDARLARDRAEAVLGGFKLTADALSSEGDALRAEAIATLKDAEHGLQKAYAETLSPAPKKRKSKSPRAIKPRDSFPADFERFGRWLRYRIEEFDDFREGEDIEASAPVEGINPEALAEKTKVPADNIRAWVKAVGEPKFEKDKLYPTTAQKRACMNYCTNHLGYFEPGLAAMYRIVQFLFVLMEQRGISNESLARETCLSPRTIEAWGGNDPNRAPRFQDVLACFQALDMPLAAVSYEADRAFQNAAAEAALKLRPEIDWDVRPEAHPPGPK